MAAHLSAFAAVMGLPFGHIIGPLVVYLTQRERSAFVAEHGKASLNFQITVSLAALALVVVLGAGWIGLLLALPNSDSTIPVWVAALAVVAAGAVFAGAIAVLALIVAATVAASNDRLYRYPFTIAFIR